MKDYSDILNRKKTSDRLGDAFTDQANSMRPMNVGQRREQALLRGLGVGLNSDDEREAKLAELENMSKEAAFAKINLEKEAATNQLKGEKLKSFVVDYDADLQMASSLIQQGKYDQLDILAPSLIKGYEEKTGKKLGKYLFSKNGHSAFKQEDGQINTVPIKDLFNPIMNVIPPENRGSYKGFATTYQAQELDAIVESRKLQQDQMRASTEASRASVRSSDAHAKLYESQSEKSSNEIGELEKLNYKNQLDKNSDEYRTKLKVNNDYIENLSKENTKAENIIPILDEFGNLLENTPELFGSGKWMEAKRAFAKFTGDDAPIQRANYLQKYFFPEIKGIAGNPNQREWVDLVGKIISESQNVEAAKTQIELDKEILAKKQREFNVYTDTLGTMGHDKFYYDPEIKSRVSRKIKILEEKEAKGLTEIIDEDGNIINVPIKR